MYPDFAGKSVLVTGGSGFIGRHLCFALSQSGAEVHSVDLVPFPPPITSGDPHFIVDYIVGDIGYQPLLREAFNRSTPDIVFHLAGISQVGDCFENPVESSYVNAMGTLLVLDECRAKEVRLVVSTTDKVYGQRDRHDQSLEAERAFQFGFGEGDAFRPRHPYEASKGAADLFCQAYAYCYGVNVAVLRCGNVFGPYDLNLDRLMPSVLRDLCAGKRPALRTRKPDAKREYLFIGDALDAFLLAALCLDQRPYGFFNVAAGNTHSVIDIVARLGSLYPEWHALEPEFIDKRGAMHESAFLALNSLAFREATGWNPTTDFSNALKMTADWYREYFSGPHA